MNGAEKGVRGERPVKPWQDPVLLSTNLKFLFSSIFLVCFLVGNFLIMNHQVRHAENDSQILGFMEGQYGVVQKTTFLSIAYAQSIDVLERKAFRENVHEELRSLLIFNTTSNDIISEKTQLPPSLIPTLRRIYLSSPAPLNSEVEGYLSALKKFLMGSPIKVHQDNLQLLAFREKGTRLLGSLRTSVKDFQREAESQIIRLKYLGQILFILSFFCLGLIGALVFLPTLKVLKVYLDRLKNMNAALEVKVSERTEELERKARQLESANAELREQIDERVKIEKELRQTNAFLDSIIDNIPNMLFIKDAEELRFVLFNRAGEDLIGYKRGDLLGKNDYSFFPKDQADFFIEKDQAVLRGGTLLEIPEEPILTKKKGSRILHTRKMPIMGPDGKPAFLLGVSEDITERIQDEQRLRELSLAMENALDGIALLDPDKKYLSVNKAYAAMMRYATEEMVGLDRVTMICPEDAEKAQQAFEEMRETGRAETEIRTLRKDGSIFPQYVVLVKNVDKERRFNGFYCFARDMTEHKYQESLEIKAELIQMVSHELRTPIHSVKEGLSIVLEGLTGEITPEQKEVLSISKRCVDRLVRLVNDVLAFHKLEAGVIEFHMKKENVNQLIEDVEASMRPLVENKNLALHLALQKDLPEVEFDHDKIIQVLTNFLQNAIKFTPKGEVTITSSTCSQGVRVSVKDTGVGIQKKDIPKLFRKFGQLESAKLVAPGGTGLGLAISKTIVERHHGKIEMESEYTKGSIFSFTLPLEQPKPSKKMAA